MPSRNVYKTLVRGGYYHVFNRGIEKRSIFLDTQDYSVFLNNLKMYLTEPAITALQGTTLTSLKIVPRQCKNYCTQIHLLAYCLMPNHFHFLIKQIDDNSLKNFMKSFTVKYSMYFNKKYDRVGQLFQGRYKAVLITEDNYLLHLSRYIHLNPTEHTSDLVSAYSSYGEYLGFRKTEWVRSDFVLNFFKKKVAPEFKKVLSYKDFVENYKKDSAEVLGRLTLED